MRICASDFFLAVLVKVVWELQNQELWVTPLWKKKCGFHQHQNKQDLNVIWVRTPTPPWFINQDQPTSHDFAKTSHESSHGFSKHPWLVEHTMPKAYEVFGDMVWQILFLIPLAFCIFLCWGARPREARPTFLWTFASSRKTQMSEHVLEIILINFARGWRILVP